MTDEEVLKQVLSGKGKIRHSIINKKEISDYLLNRFNDCKDVHEAFMRIKLKKYIKPICPICWRTMDFNKKLNNFPTYCSIKCCGKSCINKANEAVLEKYGENNPNKVKELVDKRKETNTKRYGVDSYSKTEKFRKEISEKIDYDEVKKKCIETNLKKYKVSNPMKLDSIKQKSIESQKSKYNGLMYVQTKEGKQRLSETNSSEEVINKSKNTCLEKYGKESYTQTEEYAEKYLSNLPFSKSEETVFGILLEFFDESDIFRQYSKDSRYPFPCDFYIKSIDTFIEYQGFISHGRHPFDPSNSEDIEYINSLESQIKDIEDVPSKKERLNRLKEFLKVFKERDPLKRKIAKENNLNFIEFWPSNGLPNEKEIREVIKKLKLK